METIKEKRFKLNGRAVKEILSCAREKLLETILTPILIVGEVGLEVAIPYIMSNIIDKGIELGDLKSVLIYGAAMLVMAAFSLFFGAMAARTSAVAAMSFSKNLRKKLFDKVQDFSFFNVDKFSTASLVTRLTTDVTFVQNAFMMSIRVAFRAPIMLIAAFTMSATVNAKLSLIFLATIPVLAFALIFIGLKAMPAFEKMFKRFDAMNAKIQENLIGIRVVKAFVRENHETEAFRKASKSVQDTQLKAEKLMVFANPLMMFCMYACMLTVIWFGGNFIISGSMTTGELMSFISYIAQILMSLGMIGMIFVMLVMSQASVERIGEVLSEETDIKNPEGGLQEVANGDVTFENVAFSYKKEGGSKVLEEINLTVKEGMMVGIIGGTGVGKSSLVQLIPRLYDVTEGKVSVGGKDVRDYDLNTLRGAVAMVLQKNVLFSGTIRENLLWGNPNATEEELIDATKNACAHDFITSFPNGYDTDLGQGGVNVSGGQKQRLCIARALLKKPKIMILDDSTSAVDTATDAAIRAALKENLQSTTVFIIAQRVTSVMDADMVVVMDDGKINAVGTHDELLQNNAIYREVFESQQKGVED